MAHSKNGNVSYTKTFYHLCQQNKSPQNKCIMQATWKYSL